MPGHRYPDRCWCGCIAPPIAGSGALRVRNYRRGPEAGRAALLQLPALTCPPEGVSVIVTKPWLMPALRMCHAVPLLRERLSSTANFPATGRWRVSD